MSEREKVLVMILVVAGFLVVNALAVNMFFLPKLRDAKKTEKEMKDLKLDLELALIEQEERSDEIEWLNRAEKESTQQKALADLEKLANREAKSRGLTIKKVDPLTAFDHP